MSKKLVLDQAPARVSPRHSTSGPFWQEGWSCSQCRLGLFHYLPHWDSLIGRVELGWVHAEVPPWVCSWNWCGLGAQDSPRKQATWITHTMFPAVYQGGEETKIMMLSSLSDLESFLAISLLFGGHSGVVKAFPSLLVWLCSFNLQLFTVI